MTDKPRKIVICHPDDFTRVNEAVMALDFGDVLVRQNRYIEVGKTYIMDGDLLDYRPITGGALFDPRP